MYLSHFKVVFLYSNPKEPQLFHPAAAKNIYAEIKIVQPCYFEPKMEDNMPIRGFTEQGFGNLYKQFEH